MTASHCTLICALHQRKHTNSLSPQLVCARDWTSKMQNQFMISCRFHKYLGLNSQHLPFGLVFQHALGRLRCILIGLDRHAETWRKHQHELHRFHSQEKKNAWIGALSLASWTPTLLDTEHASYEARFWWQMFFEWPPLQFLQCNLRTRSNRVW